MGLCVYMYKLYWKLDTDKNHYFGTCLQIYPLSSRLAYSMVQKPVIVLKSGHVLPAVPKLRQISLSLLLSPTHHCCCIAQWSPFTISAFSFCLSAKRQAENRAQSFMVYIKHNTFSAFGGGETQASVFVCILFQNIKLNQSFNTLDCINMGENCLNKYKEWKWISHLRGLFMNTTGERNKQDIKIER